MAAAELRPEQCWDLAGRDGGRAGAAAEAGPLHGHPDHRAAHQKAQGIIVFLFRLLFYSSLFLFSLKCIEFYMGHFFLFHHDFLSSIFVKQNNQIMLYKLSEMS